MATVAERIAAKVDTVGDHLVWLGATAAEGTPQIRVNGRLTTVRRVVWELAHGPLPGNVTVSACPEEPTCVRLEHLGLGRTRRTLRQRADPTPRRRARRGSGSMREVRSGVWELAVSFGGTRRYRTVHGRRADAAAALAVFAAGGADPGGALGGLVAEYLVHLEGQGRSPATVGRYRQLWRDWLSPTLAAADPAGITRRQLERALAAMAKAGQSASSVHQAAVLLSGTLAWAHRHGHVATNPTLGLRLPGGAVLAPPRRR